MNFKISLYKYELNNYYEKGSIIFILQFYMFFRRQFMNNKDSQFWKGGDIGGFNTNNFGEKLVKGGCIYGQ